MGSGSSKEKKATKKNPTLSPVNTRKSLKILVVGDPGVGKSAVLLRLVENTFTDASVTNFVNDYKTKEIVLEQHKSKVKLELWDTGGQER